MAEILIGSEARIPAFLVARGVLTEDAVAGHALTMVVADTGHITLRLARPEDANDRDVSTGLLLVSAASAGAECQIYSNGAVQPEDRRGA